MQNTPETIYLNLGFDKEEYNDIDFFNLDGVTWCTHEQNSADIKYIRADKYERAIETLKAIAKPIEQEDANLALYVRQNLAERALKELG